MKTDINSRRNRKISRVRAKISGTAARPRLAVFKSNRAISVQLIDDAKATTLGISTSATIKDKIKPIEKAQKVGEMIAEVAAAKKITEAVFDRRDKKYHGQVKALAEGARAKGLKI